MNANKKNLLFFLTIYKTGDYLLCIEEINKFLNQKITKNGDASIAEIMNILGASYHSIRQFNSAINSYQKAIEISEQLQNFKKTADYYVNLAGVYIEQIDYLQSIKTIQKAIEFRVLANDFSGLIKEYLQLSTSYLFLENLEEAELFLTKAKKLNTVYDFQSLYPNILFEEGRIYKRKGIFGEAIASFKQAYRFSRKNKLHRISLKSIESIADTYLKSKQYEKAKQFSLKSIKIANELNLENWFGKEILMIALFNLNYLDKFKVIFDEFIQITNLKPEHQISIFEYASLYYHATNQTALAFEYAQKHLEAYKKFYNTSINQKVIQLQAQFESERKDNQLQQLKWQQAQAELKALRSQLNPHFIFNTLNLFRNEMKKGNIQKADELLVSFSKLLRLVLDCSRHTTTPIRDTIQLIQVYLELENARAQKPILLHFKISPALKKSNLPLSPLFIQPLLENAILHGLNPLKKRNPTLLIKIRKKKSVWVITVEDNGIGRKAASKISDKNKPSHATAMIQESLELLCEPKNLKPHFETTDLFDEHKKPIGTRVQIHIPW